RQQQEEWRRWERREYALGQRPWVLQRFVEQAHRQAGPQGLQPPPGASYSQMQAVAGLLSSERRAEPPPPPAQDPDSVRRCKEKYAKLADGVPSGYVFSQTGQFLRVIRPADAGGRPVVTFGMLDEKNDDASLFQLLRDEDKSYYLRSKLTQE